MSREPVNPASPPTEETHGALPAEIEPPAELEDRVAGALLSAGLIGPERASGWRGVEWRNLRAPLAALACAASIMLGVVIGRVSSAPAPPAASPLTGAETDLYALLLFETDGYDAARGAEAYARYGEYNAWVAEARRRGQFVTGEDLATDQGWLVAPSSGAPDVRPANAIDAGAPLSGIFFIRARDADEALELARELPHVRHGGQVLVQPTIPTDTPPDASAD